MYCRSCGAALEDTARFCGECGAPAAENTTTEKPSAPTAQSTPVTPPYPPATPPAAPAKKPVGAVRNIFAVLLILPVFALLLGSSLLFSLQAFLGPSAIDAYFQNLDTDDLIDLKVLDLGVTDLSEAELKELYEETDIGEFLSTAAADFAKNMLYGQNNKMITGEDIADMLRDNREAIEEISGYALTEEDLEDVEQYFASEGKAELEAVMDDFAQEMDETVLTVWYTIMSPYLPLILLVIAAAIFAVILLIRRARISTLIWGGTPSLIAALPPLALLLSGDVFIEMMGSDTFSVQIMETFIANSVAGLVITAVAFAGVGIAMIVLGAVLSSRRKKSV